jgi:hypothetical protein
MNNTIELDRARSLEVITTLANGIDPLTGEIFPKDHTLQHPDVVRALFGAALALQGGNGAHGSQASPARSAVALPQKAGLPWSAEEDHELIAGFESGSSERQLSEKHQRTRNAIRARLIRLGLVAPTEGTPLRNVSP